MFFKEKILMKEKITELTLTFSTPIWTSIIPKHRKINEKMFTYIKSLQKKDRFGINRSNLLGWHSKNFDLELEQLRFFVNSISPQLNSVLADMGWDIKNQEVKITGMWAIINNKNSSNAMHIHSNNYISAAYYVKAPKNCGDLVFYDPRFAATYRYPKISKTNKLNSNIVAFQPKEGMLVLFPSYLQHSVNVSKTDEERIVISFNINLI
jgi:uncharacterized protein (TIGR02466 family)